MTVNKSSFYLAHLIVLPLTLAASIGAQAAADGNLPNVFTFAAGYRMDSPSPRNLVEYGVVRKCGNGWCMDSERYDSAKMLPRTPTKYMHDMHAPYGNGKCANGPVTTIQGDEDTDKKVAFQPTGNGFLVIGSDYRYRWIADPKASDGYTLAEISYKKAQLEQVVGFAFASDSQIKGNLTKAEISYNYKGEIYHKTALSRVDGPWVYAPSSLNFSFYEEAENGSLLLRSLPGDPSVVKKYGKPMWVQSSIVLTRGTKAIAPLVQEYGHDFNMDGCFNESGHNKLMLPVGNGSVTSLIYVEYTSDYERGFPMLSVGRYYR